ncbi:MAG TPA: DNA-formamidopyrimidine glycosylase family protein [Vicinamibacteria bacterium]|nr:DNA-formamidopyrimidine glycosylase family protein [Vicinamibacteria bacterium]
MPELPEVEAARRRLHRVLAGRRLVEVRARDDRLVLAGTTPRAVEKALTGRRVRAVKRRGKHLWLELDRRPWPAFHFGMTGSFEPHEGELPRWWRLVVRTDRGLRLVFRDPRRFGRIRLQQDPPREPPIALLGFDPLLAPPTSRQLRLALSRRRGPLKAVLLDQTLFAVVGNWVADEVLYQARLSPLRPAVSLTAAEVARLRAALLTVIRRAVAAGADSDRFPRTWLFHSRWGRARDAVTARREVIRHLTVGGRTTAWVPARQR